MHSSLHCKITSGPTFHAWLSLQTGAFFAFNQRRTTTVTMLSASVCNDTIVNAFTLPKRVSGIDRDSNCISLHQNLRVSRMASIVPARTQVLVGFLLPLRRHLALLQPRHDKLGRAPSEKSSSPASRTFNHLFSPLGLMCACQNQALERAKSPRVSLLRYSAFPTAVSGCARICQNLLASPIIHF